MIYSVGHSNMDFDKFSELIKELDILMDIRSHPSSKWPQFCIENLRESIPKLDKEYVWEPGLGGWRKQHLPMADEMSKVGIDINAYTGKFPKQRIAKSKIGTSDKPAWTNQGLYDFSYFMAIPEFLAAASNLISIGTTKNVGIMCCECLWWACHRSMVADYLYTKGVEVIHLQPKRTLHSAVISNRIERYDEVILEIWKGYDQ